MSSACYGEFTVPPDLRRSVRRVWVVQPSLDDHHAAWETVIPDGSVELVVHRGAPWLHRFPGGEAVRQREALYCGQLTGPVQLRGTVGSRVLGVRLEPGGARAVARTGQDEAADRIVAFEDLGVSRMSAVVRRAQAADSDEEAAALLLGGVRACLAADDDFGRPASTDVAIELIRRSGGVMEIGEVARRVRISRRQLERLFLREVGVTPKHAARVARVHRFIRRRTLRASERQADAAARCGYFDESHLIRDFRSLTGESPKAYFRRYGFGGERRDGAECTRDGRPDVAFLQFGGVSSA